MTLIALWEADEEKQLVNSQNTTRAAEPQCHEILFTNASVAVCPTPPPPQTPPDASLPCFEDGWTRASNTIRSGAERASGADGRVGRLPGCRQIMGTNLGKQDAVSLFYSRNVKYGWARKAWILDESGPAKCSEPREGSWRFSPH